MATPITTGSSAVGFRPDVVSIAPSDAVPDALILGTTTVSGTVEGDAQAVRAIHVTDDNTLGFVAEGAAIDEDEPTLAETVVYTGKVAQLTSVSREQYMQVNTAGLLSESMQRAVVRKANSAFIAQLAPTSPAVTPPAGILTQATDDGDLELSLDALIDTVAAIESDGGQATNVIASPTAWAFLSRFRESATSARTLLGAGTDATERRILGVPVLTSSAVPAGKLLVVDRSAIVSALGNVQVATSEHALFAKDSIAVRVSWRFGAKVVKAARVRALTVVEPDPLEAPAD